MPLCVRDCDAEPDRLGYFAALASKRPAHLTFHQVYNIYLDIILFRIGNRCCQVPLNGGGYKTGILRLGKQADKICCGKYRM